MKEQTQYSRYINKSRRLAQKSQSCISFAYDSKLGESN